MEGSGLTIDHETAGGETVVPSHGRQFLQIANGQQRLAWRVKAVADFDSAVISRNQFGHSFWLLSL